MPATFNPSTKRARAPLDRTSPRKRGYDALWDRKAREYRRQHPFCGMCEQSGRLRFGDVVDHKFPVVDGGAVHCDEDGVWTLCNRCHGTKLWMEREARKLGLMHEIKRWCDDPQARPRKRGTI